MTEFILILLEFIAKRFGFGLVPLDEAEVLSNLPIPYNIPRRKESET